MSQINHTVEPLYDTVYYIRISQKEWKWHMQDIKQIINSQTSLHTLPSQASCGVVFVSILEQNSHVTKRFNHIKEQTNQTAVPSHPPEPLSAFSLMPSSSRLARWCCPVWRRAFMNNVRELLSLLSTWFSSAIFTLAADFSLRISSTTRGSMAPFWMRYSKSGSESSCSTNSLRELSVPAGASIPLGTS